jgi:tetratricopeptide (TPR) repeat protein
MQPSKPLPKAPGLFTRHPRMRVALIVLLFGGGAVALYQIGRHVWASVQYQKGIDAAARHDYKQALIHVGRYLDVHPQDWEGWILAVRTARQANDIDQAMRHLRQAEKNGAPPLALGLESRLLIVQSGHLQEAEKLLNYCIKHPDREEVPLMLQAVAEGCLQAGDATRVRTAADMWLQLRRGNHDQSQGYVWLGQADKISNDVGPALAHFEKAVDLAPEHPMARVHLVSVLVHDQPQRARPHLELLRRQHPDDPEVLFQTARMHRYLGESEEAIKLLDQLFASGITRVPALVERAKASLDLMRPHEAAPLLRKALAAAPYDRMANVAMADCLRQLNQPDEAKAYDEKAQEIEAKVKHKQSKDKKQ